MWRHLGINGYYIGARRYHLGRIDAIGRCYSQYPLLNVFIDKKSKKINL